MPEGENQIPESSGFHGSLDSRLINVYHTVRKTRVVQETMRHKESRWPVHGWVGLILIAVCWPLNWTLPGVRTSYLFFPLWLGYILVVDALVQVRTGTSIRTRSRKNFLHLFLISAPINYWTSRPHFLEQLRNGDWRTVISLSFGALICGFFWEMWNYYSFPKWTYHIPGLGFWRIFEMPLLGYGGYIPFALEVYALKNFVWPNGPRLEPRG